MARTNQQEEKRAQLLAVAAKCFSQFGFHKTTLDDIARAAGMHKASLYHYFNNKESLFLAVMLQVSETGQAQILAEALTHANIPDRLTAFFLSRMQLYLQMIRLHGLSKEAILKMQPLFDSVYTPIRQAEMQQVLAWVQAAHKNILLDISSVHLLFDVVDALKHDALLMGEVLTQTADEPGLAQKISSVVGFWWKGIACSAH